MFAVSNFNRTKFLKRSKTKELALLAIPGVVLFFIFNYLPMLGLVLAFKDFRYDKGLFGSPWAGLTNFKFFFTSQDAWRVTRNTIGYNFVFIITVIVGSVIFAIMLNEIQKRILIKVYQTVLFFPYFLSWSVIAFMTYALFNRDFGLLNHLYESLKIEPVSWYSEPLYWIPIMIIVHFWKVIGYNTIIIYAALIAIDSSYYESAAIDGATKLQTITKITIPLLMPIIVIMTLLMMGKIFYSDFGQFYMVPKDAGALYSTTDVIDTYVYRTLKESGEIGMASAVGLYQSVVGFLVVILSNWAIRKFNKENALF